MACIVLIHRNGSVIPSVPEAVRKGDTFQWVINGDLKPLAVALNSATRAADGTWEIEHSQLTEASAQ